MAQRVKDQGRDPDAMLAKHLPKEELSRVARKITFAPPASMKGKMAKPKGAATQAPKGTAGKPTGRPTGAGKPTAPKPTKGGGRPTGGRPTGGSKNKNKNKGRP